MDRKKNECPLCRIDGYVLLKEGKDNGYSLVFSGKATDFICPKCNLEWDINEDFLCTVCGQEVQGRFLTCGDPLCVEAFG